MRYITAKEMQDIDGLAQEKFGIPSIILMENAGKEAARVALDMISGNTDVVCICGKGNNGGDGLVCARHLINKGLNVGTFLLGSPNALKQDPKKNYEMLKNSGTKINILKNEQDFSLLNNCLNKTHLIIDAIFGIGLTGKVKEPYKTIIDLINQSNRPVLAMDIPSGLDATTGKKLGNCIKASKTVTFAFPKTGFVKNDGPDCVGEVVVADISIPKALMS